MTKDKTYRLAVDFYKNLGAKGMASLTNNKKDKAILKFILPFLKNRLPVLLSKNIIPILLN